VRLADLVAQLDAEFRVAEVRGDDWAEIYAQVYPEPYWREFVEPGYEQRWNGLVLRGAEDVRAAATCVFPSDAVFAALAPGTLLFSEHSLDFADRPGFLALARSSFESARERGISFYNVHAPLDMHPRLAPSRLVAEGVGLDALDEFFPVAQGILGGAVVAGDTGLTLDGLADALRAFLGRDIPVHVITRPRQAAGRVAVAAGGGAQREALQAALDRGCDTYVTGNASTSCTLELVQREVAGFRALADEVGVALVDATHYGTERPSQLAMVRWFEQRGLPCGFVENGPK
jgi:putative NIF3 family GTP cyclohydrolase 1 type 2